MATVTTGQQSTATGQRRITFHGIWSVLIGVFWFAILVGVIGGYFLHLDTGFPANGKLWDWLQLLSAPVFVSVLPFLFKGQRSEADSKPAEQPSQTDGGITRQLTLADEEARQQRTALEAYQDHILQLVLDRSLKGSQPGSDVREAARARTLAVLRRVGKNHKGDVLQFLYEAGLIYTGQMIIDLREADMSQADLSNANLNGSELSGIDLSGARLNKTVLSNARLGGADLSGTDLGGASLRRADLTGANLKDAIGVTAKQLELAQSLEDAIMPNGEKHP